MRNELVRIRLTNPTLAALTGQFGGYDFESGVSGPMLRREAERLSVITNVEFLDAENMWERKQRERGQMSADKVTSSIQIEPAPELDAALSESHSAPLYTREQLEAIADKDGINGLRKIGDTVGVRGTSIRVLIESILQAQP